MVQNTDAAIKKTLIGMSIKSISFNKAKSSLRLTFSQKETQLNECLMLTQLELTVIMLAFRDPVSSIRPQNRISQFFLGKRRQLSLADPQLEALRQYTLMIKQNSNINFDYLLKNNFSNKKIKQINKFIIKILSDFNIKN